MAALKEPDVTNTEATQRRSLPLLAVVLLGIALVLAVFIGTNVLGVLFGVVAPPLPPLPPAMSQVEHTSSAYGVDYWKYSSPTEACEVVQYIRENGGVCMYAPLQCAEYREIDGEFTTRNEVVARCGGATQFSIFNMQWWGLVMRTSDAQTQLELGREVFWIGTGPQ